MHHEELPSIRIFPSLQTEKDKETERRRSDPDRTIFVYECPEAIFRAVEVRTPIVIAANTGFSASVDGCGRLLACGPRRKTATLRVTVVPDGRWTLWLLWGSFLPGICVAITVTVALEHWVRRGTLA